MGREGIGCAQHAASRGGTRRDGGMECVAAVRLDGRERKRPRSPASRRKTGCQKTRRIRERRTTSASGGNARRRDRYRARKDAATGCVRRVPAWNAMTERGSAGLGRSARTSLPEPGRKSGTALRTALRRRALGRTTARNYADPGARPCEGETVRCVARIRRGSPASRRGRMAGMRMPQCFARNGRITSSACCGCSSMIQCPEFWMTAPSTFVATYSSSVFMLAP